MATQSCDSEPDAKALGDNNNVVFIDTNLDTHLAVIVSEADTVSDLKKRILLEHLLCFPKIGQIQIHAIKVKRKGYFYHLSDSMFVRSAFNGCNKSWFLSVDASALGEHGQNDQLSSPVSPKQVTCLGIANNALIGSVNNLQSIPSKRVSSFNNFQLPLLENKQDEKDEIAFVSPCVSENTGKAVKDLATGVRSSSNKDLGILLPGSNPKTQDHGSVNHELSSSYIECEVDGSSKCIKYDCNECEASKSVPSPNKKRKSKRKKEDNVQDDSSKENTASVDNHLSFPSERMTSSNNFQLPPLENKLDEKEQIPFVSLCVSEHTGTEAFQNLETGVKSSGNNDPGVPLPGSIAKTWDHGSLNHELPSSHIECEVDGSNKGIKDDHVVREEGTSKSDPIAKKKRKGKRKKEGTVGGDTSKENNASVVEQVENAVLQDMTQDHGSLNDELPSSHIECEVDGSSKGIKDGRNVCEEGTPKTEPNAKKKRKGKRKKEDMVEDDTSKENNASLDNLPSFPSEMVTGSNNFCLPQLENKQDEKEQIPFVSLCVSEHTVNEAFRNLETDVKYSGNNDPGVPLPGSIPKTQDHGSLNHKLPSSHIECGVGGSNKGIKDDDNVCEEGTSKSDANAKKKQKGKRKKEGTVGGDTSKENNASVVEQVENAVLQDMTQDHGSLNDELPSSHIECEVDGSSKGVKDGRNVCEEGTPKTEPSAKKKRKGKRKKEDMVEDDTSKKDSASVVEQVENAVQQDIVVPANPSENADKQIMKEAEVLKDHHYTDCKNNNTKIDIDAECNELLIEASEPRTVANKKRRKRKKSLTHVSKEEILNVETACQKDEAQKSDEACKERKELKDQYEFNNDKSSDEVVFKHDMETEDATDTRPPTTKKQKGEENGGDESSFKEKWSMIIDFNVDNASHQILRDQQKIKCNSADQSTEHFNDTDPLRTSVVGGRRKWKKKSSNPHQTPRVTSPRKDDEADRSRTEGEGVLEEISEDGLFSKGDATKEMGEIRKGPPLLDVSMSKTSLENMEIRTDACKEGIQSKVKRTGNSKNKCAIDTKLHPYDVNGPKELTEDNRNIVLDRCHKSEAGQTEGMEEGREISPHNDPKPMLSDKLTPSNQNNKDGNTRELNLTSKDVDVNGITEPVKPEKKRRMTKIPKDSGAGPAHKEVIGLVDATESETTIVKSLKATNCDPTSGNTVKEENPLNQTEGKNIGQKDIKGTFLSSTDKEDNFLADNAGSLEQIKAEANAEHVDKKHRKKSNNKQTSNVKSILNMLTEDQVLDSKKPSTSFREKEDNNLETPSKSDRINADQQFTSVQQQHEASMSVDILVDKINGATDIENFSSAQQLFSKEDGEVLRIQADKKIFNVHRTGQKLSTRSNANTDRSSMGENRKPHVNASGKNMVLEKQSEHFPVSNLKLEGSKKMVQNTAGKAPGNNIGGVVSNTLQKKSLLAGAIFKDDGSSTSEDEDEVDNSDASTRTPSDNSLLSDYSDGDSHAGLDSQQYGSHDGKRLEDGGRSALKASLSGTEGMSIDHILRSSRRYKKAKVTATQLQETESQPVDLVPDSLADT